MQTFPLYTLFEYISPPFRTGKSVAKNNLIKACGIIRRYAMASSTIH